MANKNHPGPFNCHAAALPDEPLFTILARDPAGPETIMAWRMSRVANGKNSTVEDADRLEEAFKVAEEMETWRAANLDPTGDGIPSWKLPRNQVEEDERPATGGLYYACPVDNPEDPFDDEYAVVFVDDDSPVCSVRSGMVVGGTREACLAQAHRIAAAMNASVAPVADAPDIYQEAADAILNPRIENMHRLKARSVGKAAELGMGYGKSAFQTEMDADEDQAESLTVPDEVPAHRFAHFRKGERYAYAKGLEVSPVHLPAALDAMAASGWHLLSIFGETDSKNVGFIFERRDYSPMIRYDVVWPDDYNKTKPQSPQMDAYESGRPLGEIDTDLGRGVQP